MLDSGFRMTKLSTGIIAFALSVAAIAAQTPVLPPTPAGSPAGIAPAQPKPAVQPANLQPLAPSPAPQRAPQRPAFQPQPTQAPRDVTALQFDDTVKEYTAKPGDLMASYTFAVTNISKEEVTINWVRPSCGCTAAKVPPVPWKIAPGEGGTMQFDLDLKGKHGLLSKYIQVDSSHGQKLLNIKANISAEAATGGMDQRTRNMQMALADRQVVFRGDCAKCHSEPAVGKMAEPLFAAACAICHEAPHRATMVPDLANLKTNPGTKEYWKMWVTTGKPGSLMPAFAKAHGGPLTDEQIDSLAEFLTKKYPAKTVASGGAAGGQ